LPKNDCWVVLGGASIPHLVGYCGFISQINYLRQKKRTTHSAMLHEPSSPLSARERPAGLPTVAELGELVRLEAEEVGALARVSRVVALLHDGRRDRGGHVA
jgi:hypothetical protein